MLGDFLVGTYLKMGHRLYCMTNEMSGQIATAPRSLLMKCLRDRTWGFIRLPSLRRAFRCSFEREQVSNPAAPERLGR